MPTVTLLIVFLAALGFLVLAEHWRSMPETANVERARSHGTPQAKAPPPRPNGTAAVSGASGAEERELLSDSGGSEPAYREPQDPVKAEKQAELSAALLKRGRKRAAERHMKWAVRLDPDNPTWRVELAVLQHALKDDRAARRQLGIALRLGDEGRSLDKQRSYDFSKLVGEAGSLARSVPRP